MSQNKKPRNGSGKPDHAPDGVTPRRRRRLPVRAELKLDDNLPANEHHPLGNSAPEARTAGRHRIIGSVLARLARAGMRRRA